MKLFASDLDGTLLDREDGIHPEDVRAIDWARKQGVVFTLATGRLTSRTHPTADRLGLDAPLVCADGGVTVSARTREVQACRAIDALRVERILSTFADAELGSFVFTPGAIHSCERGARHHPYVRIWSHDITTHADILSAEGWRKGPDGMVMLLGIGAAKPVEEAWRALDEHGAHLEMLTFPASPELSVLRLVAQGVSKGAALAALAARLGIAREDVAVAGDWYNDSSMFEWAGRSFAMPQSPEPVKALATDVLPEGSREKGAIAMALEKWLRGD